MNFQNKLIKSQRFSVHLDTIRPDFRLLASRQIPRVRFETFSSDNNDVDIFKIPDELHVNRLFHYLLDDLYLYQIFSYFHYQESLESERFSTFLEKCQWYWKGKISCIQLPFKRLKAFFQILWSIDIVQLFLTATKAFLIRVNGFPQYIFKLQ